MHDLIERADLRRPVALKLAVLVLADVARHGACRLDHLAESAGLHGIGSQFVDHDAPPYFLVAGSDRIAISCRQFQHPFDAARLRRSNFYGEAPLDRLSKILHEFVHAVALCGAAGYGWDFRPEATLFRFMYDNLDLHFDLRSR